LRSFQLQTLKNNCFRQQRSGDIIAWATRMLQFSVIHSSRKIDHRPQSTAL
jgi:hypothetical protein